MFNKNCSGCHNFKQNNIGPQLSGITKEVSVEWLKNFIHNPERLIQSNDKRADSLYHFYKTLMPSFFSLSDDEINNIIAFLNTHNERKINDTTTGIKDPIPEKIKLSNLVVKLQLVTQFPASSDSNKKTPWQELPNSIISQAQEKLFIVDLRGKLYSA